MIQREKDALAKKLEKTFNQSADRDLLVVFSALKDRVMAENPQNLVTETYGMFTGNYENGQYTLKNLRKKDE